MPTEIGSRVNRLDESGSQIDLNYVYAILKYFLAARPYRISFALLAQIHEGSYIRGRRCW